MENTKQYDRGHLSTPVITIHVSGLHWIAKRKFQNRLKNATPPTPHIQLCTANSGSFKTVERHPTMINQKKASVAMLLLDRINEKQSLPSCKRSNSQGRYTWTCVPYQHYFRIYRKYPELWEEMEAFTVLVWDFSTAFWNMRALGDKKMSKDTEKVNNIFIGLEDEHRSLTLHLSFKYVFSGICGTFKKIHHLWAQS